MFRENQVSHLGPKVAARGEELGDKPGASGAVINGVFVNEAIDANLCFKKLNLEVICFGVSRKRYAEFS